jgi:endonuclease/exonuclease/phosphatase family metal-dependent hydrolase
MEHLSESNNPVILCGDLNDIPYSYAYHEINSDLNNSFVQAGRGFGFTFNGKMFFLRIDHQFFNKDFKINSFTTHREMKLSDHFPVTGKYSLIRKDETP